MEIYVTGKDMPKYCNECEYCIDYSDGCIQCLIIDDNSGSYDEDINELKKLDDCPLKSLEQHDAEVKKQEREKVIAELDEWVDNKASYRSGDLKAQFIEIYKINKKLNEMKGETK